MSLEVWRSHERSSTGTNKTISKVTWKNTIFNNINFLAETFGSHSYGEKCSLCDVWGRVYLWMNPKINFVGCLVTNHSWRVHLSELGGGVTTGGIELFPKNAHDTRFLCMIVTCTIDRTTTITSTMCVVNWNLIIKT